MSNLEELIQEFCPNGVEYVKIKDVFTRLKGTSITAGKMKEIETSNGEIKIFAGGKTVINANECDIPNANITRVPAVLVQSRGVIDFIYYDQPFTFKNEMWAYTAKNIITVKYLYYVLKNNVLYFRESASGMGALPQISLGVTEDFIVPLPALPVQREIVRILDSFTLYSAELTAELTARRKQYEFYRDKLLNFNSTKIEWKTLKETCDIVDYRGKTPQKVDKGIFLVTAKNIKKGYIDYETSKEYVAKEDYVEVMHRGIPEIGDVIFTTEAPCGNVAQIDNRNVALAQRVIKYRPKNNKLNSTFLKYYLLSKNFQSVLHTKTTGGTVEGIKGSVLHQLLIPVPPIEVQERIVKVLDNFDAICSDLGIGLPAEIEKRQKQYEFYRDKLLNFKDIEEDGEKETKAKGTGKN